jgi:hypothetical protein
VASAEVAGALVGRPAKAQSASAREIRDPATRERQTVD